MKTFTAACVQNHAQNDISANLPIVRSLIREAADEKADFIVIDPEINWTFQIDDIFSKSKNSALIGEEMKGKISMAIFKNKIHIIN